MLSISKPKVCLLNLAGRECQSLVESDSSFLRSLFTDVRVVDSLEQRCDMLFLYATFAIHGEILGTTQGFREIIRDSGARVVVVANANPGQGYIGAGKPKSYGRANLVMTLDRRGERFGRFLTALFSKMKQGVSMQAAWVELSPQVAGLEHPDSPEAFFVCEIEPFAFG